MNGPMNRQRMQRQSLSGTPFLQCSALTGGAWLPSSIRSKNPTVTAGLLTFSGRGISLLNTNHAARIFFQQAKDYFPGLKDSDLPRYTRFTSEPENPLG